MRNDETKKMPVSHLQSVHVVGCGGTGAILADHLARMITGYRLETQLVLHDGDTVEEANITRQNFQPHEVGANKAEALALRLAGQYGMEVIACGQYVKVASERSQFGHSSLVISCTDTLVSRRTVAMDRPSHWLDVGNELHHGQAILGTTHEKRRLQSAWKSWNKYGHVIELPDMAAMNPGILRARKTQTKAGCADQPFAQQGFGVNAMAALAAATLTKQVLVDCEVSFHGIYFNISDGFFTPRLITRDLLAPWKPERKKTNTKTTKKRGM